jgi:hypothetical protein
MYSDIKRLEKKLEKKIEDVGDANLSLMLAKYAQSAAGVLSLND